MEIVEIHGSPAPFAYADLRTRHVDKPKIEIEITKDMVQQSAYLILISNKNSDKISERFFRYARSRKES